jgi:KUP system potassium uptake protein
MTGPARMTAATPSTRAKQSGLLIAALGVVYGDIGTSPLYALKESLAGEFGAGTSPAAVYGVLSMIFWAITLVVSIKYVLIVLRANNQGEGGILALLALVMRQVPARGALPAAATAAGLVGAAMFYGDSAITPAISVLSAIEGLQVVSPRFADFVIPLTLLVLIVLFSVQHKGTASIGRIFGGVMLAWFATLAVLGALQIAQRPEVLTAIDPVYAIAFVAANPGVSFVVAGLVLLAVTGGAALYADMGHFGRAPIQRAWFWLVMPALLLNYFGQGALVLADPLAAESPFFLLAPDWLRLPLVFLATAATVIASQAVISGAYSITAQAIKLGYLPRTAIRFTSQTAAGQIYVPLVNWTLLALVIVLVLGFGTSSDLASAYGVAVATTMTITTLGVFIVARYRWAWGLGRMALFLLPLLVVDVLFLAANSAKIATGGWFPLAFGALVFLVLTTWKRGRTLVNLELGKTGIALQPFLKSLSIYPPTRVEGTAVFMTQEAGLVPHALLHNLKHNRVMHERVIFLSAHTRNVPHVEAEDMAEVTDLEEGCWQVVVRLGFQDEYDVGAIFEVLAKHHDLELAVNECSFFLSRQNVLAESGQGMWRWRQRLFGWMLRNAQPASDFFRIPPNRVIEIGTQVVI